MLDGGYDASISKPISVSSFMQTVESLVAHGIAVQHTVH
jgi:hypothetical protein